ncbi:MAG: hydroxymethylbilane synthase [Elusimicrobia bacterium]|nr:hydroxymethylbilane synthase [Elusimicrobiota bacterium]
MKLRIGSRGSKLAVTQAESVAEMLRRAHASVEIELIRITTTGDRDAASALQSIGGKGVFVKEIEEALIAKTIDLAVHSLKDLPQTLPAGLVVGPAPKREDPRDAVISRFGELLRELPRGSKIGTGSPRRVAQIRHNFPKRGYHLEPVRGNVDTRVKKLRDGEFDAIVLAAAGLKRLGLHGDITEILEPDEMLPAPGQGLLGLELREDDKDTWRLLEVVRDPASDSMCRAERAFLQGLGGDCLLPVGAYSAFRGETLLMKAILLNVDGTRAISVEQDGPAEAPELVGAQLAERLFHDGGSDLLLMPNASRLT